MARQQKISRYNTKDRAQRFISWVISLFACVVAIYLIAHFVWKPCCTAPPVSKMVKVLPTGRVVVLDAEAIDWYIGKKAKTILQELAQRGAQMTELLRELDKTRIAVEERAKAQGLGGLAIWESLIADGKFEELLHSLDHVRNDWPSPYPDLLGRQALNELADKISRAAILQKEQQELLDSLRPPVATSCFWTTPCSAMFEVLFWALFGVITNLLVTSVEYLRKGLYRPVERWVAYTKLIYGPVLSLILVMAILNGWFDLGQYETRAWSLPLISFLFGFASRKTANLIDKLFERVLGAGEESIDKGPAEVAARKLANLQAIMDSAQPQSLPELKQTAQNIARDLVRAKVAEKEAHV